ncbi:hypothetical protein O181_093702 [Austropuccinia psidii MF-1]|uniref:Uncharacterized protein n=1 Tax=Austropuccinia psidii MF-1 TaxID=1389203 RepID=A0A9Q3PAR7_9BASI|nr:hypothetical protein [Austropuccinia psidii MF-1]
MKNVISERDEVIAALMQQAEDEDEAEHNPWESNDPQTKGKGKGQSTPFQNWLMLMKDAPPDFKYTKVTLPTAPDKQLLKEFYQRFSSAKEVQIVSQSSQGVKLISEAQVQTLQDARTGKRKIVKDLPPGAKQHPDEQLGEISFSFKYLESISKDYEIDPGTPESSEEGSVGSSIGNESIDLDAARGKCDVDNNFLEEPSLENCESKPELMEEENETRYQKN